LVSSQGDADVHLVAGGEPQQLVPADELVLRRGRVEQAHRHGAPRHLVVAQHQTNWRNARAARRLVAADLRGHPATRSSRQPVLAPLTRPRDEARQRGMTTLPRPPTARW
jgi:hypothetical protein